MDKELLLRELNFKAIRSSGAGGQHVNKVSSKIELTFDLESSLGLDEEQKETLRQSLKPRLTKDLRLVLFCDATRSQHQNKEIIIKQFIQLLENGLHIPEVRKSTKIPKAVKKKRLDHKKKASEKKALRKRPEVE